MSVPKRQTVANCTVLLLDFLDHLRLLLYQFTFLNKPAIQQITFKYQMTVASDNQIQRNATCTWHHHLWSNHESNHGPTGPKTTALHPARLLLLFENKSLTTHRPRPVSLSSLSLTFKVGSKKVLSPIPSSPHRSLSNEPNPFDISKRLKGGPFWGPGSSLTLPPSHDWCWLSRCWPPGSDINLSVPWIPQFIDLLSIFKSSISSYHTNHTCYLTSQVTSFNIFWQTSGWSPNFIETRKAGLGLWLHGYHLSFFIELTAKLIQDQLASLQNWQGLDIFRSLQVPSRELTYPYISHQWERKLIFPTADGICWFPGG